MTSSPWKYFSCIIPDVKLKLQWIFKKISKWRNCRAGANFLVGNVTGSWTHYQKSQEHALHFELLIDFLAQILGKLWQFQNLTYFLTWWRHLWRHQHQKVYSSSHKQVPYLCQVWCWLLKQCGLYRVDNRQTDTNEHTCQNWSYIFSVQLIKFKYNALESSPLINSSLVFAGAHIFAGSVLYIYIYET